MRYLVGEGEIGMGDKPLIFMPQIGRLSDDPAGISLMPRTRGGVTATIVDAPRTRTMKLLNGQSLHVNANFVNANGNPALVDGEIVWESSNPGIATVTADTDHDNGATITAGPSPGTAVITATADADLGEGVMEVSAELEIVVIARGVAIGGEITPDVVGGPTPNPTPGLRPDNALPGSPDRVDNTLPDSGAQPR